MSWTRQLGNEQHHIKIKKKVKKIAITLAESQIHLSRCFRGPLMPTQPLAERSLQMQATLSRNHPSCGNRQLI